MTSYYYPELTEPIRMPVAHNTNEFSSIYSYLKTPRSGIGSSLDPIKMWIGLDSVMHLNAKTPTYLWRPGNNNRFFHDMMTIKAKLQPPIEEREGIKVIKINLYSPDIPTSKIPGHLFKHCPSLEKNIFCIGCGLDDTLLP